MGGVPLGTGVDLDPTVRQIGDDRLIGGVPRRVLRLGPAGVAALAELRLGTVCTANGAALARRLTDAGLAHPRPGAGGASSVTVLIPVYGRAGALDACLTALGRQYPVVVVDDGSPEPAAIGKVAAAHGVQLIRREINGGPAAARNTGLAAVHTDLVAFLDSDCVPPPGWIDALAGHLTDPAVAAAAPRILAAPGAPAGARNALDLGPRRGRVAPGTPIAYVPTAALLARRSALLDATTAEDIFSGCFDATLRYGEDVDLIWRLHAAGWRVRYEPSVRVDHVEPATWRGILARRFRYGSSAAGLAQRHPGAMAPLILEPWTAAGLAALLARRPVLAALASAGAVRDEQRVRHAAGVDVGAAAAVADRTAKTWRATGTYATQFLAPVLLAGLTRRRTRFAALALLAAGPAHSWWQTRPPNYRVSFVAGHVAEDVAYGAGVITGSVRARTVRPLLPVRARRKTP
ncbi:MAG TPA: mycofactocin biosynthesis glycosyltransferase MftF [Sporichthya sp.]|nr:mycofactocin biosynthesis glycosyltransferase MftF [Sporichthya sp.]